MSNFVFNMKAVIMAVLLYTNTLYGEYECLPDPCLVLSEFECETFVECRYDIIQSLCVCDSLVPIDIVIGMDSSGSMNITGWEQSINFVIDIINTGISPIANIAITQWSNIQKIIWNLNDNQNRTDIINKLNQTEWLEGDTYMKDAVQHALDIFNAYSNNINKLYVLMTDGNPIPPLSQSPCGLVSQLRKAGFVRVYNIYLYWDIIYGKFLIYIVC